MKLPAKIISGCLLAWGLAAPLLPAQTASQIGGLPLWFEAGHDGRFTAHGRGSAFAVTAGGAEFTLQKSDVSRAACRLEFIGASPATLAGDQPLGGKISRFNGDQPGQWQPGQPIFARVRAGSIYPGVDVVYYGNQQVLEYDFSLAAGADPEIIRLRFDGAKKISVNARGELVIQLDGGEIVQQAPVAYQTVGGARRTISAGYRLLDARTAAFALGAYDRSLPLVIDPLLTYSTFFGGNYGEVAWSVGVNTNDGSIYVAGQTFSTKSTNNLPFSKPGTYQTTYRGGKLTGDAFVARFDHTGTNLIYATYLGGNGNDGVLGMAVDGNGNALITGFTDSTNFPTKNALYPHLNSIRNPHMATYAVDAFVAKLSSDGTDLVYSTYLGGNSMDAAYGIALDPDGNAYIAGYSYSTNFPTTLDAFQRHLVCSNTVYINCNAFLTVMAASGGSLKYSTYLGGTNYDIARAIAYNSGRVFVAGYTTSTNFPSTNYLPGFRYLNGNTNYNKKLNGDPDAFIAAFDFNTLVPSLLYSTLLGGTNVDIATGIAADAAGNAFVAGYTTSTNFPVTATNVPYLNPAYVHTNDFKKHFTWATNGFLVKILWDGNQTAIGYSAMFGGKGLNAANGVTIDAAGNAYVVGTATCTNFPATPNLDGYLTATNHSKKNKNYGDAFIIAFNPDCTALLYSGYLGGIKSDFGNAIALDPAGNVYLAGSTDSTNFPGVSPWQSYLNGTNDMFITRIAADQEALLTIEPQISAALPVRPQLAGPPVAGQSGIILRWKLSPALCRVESSPDLREGSWQPVPQSPVFINGAYQITLPLADGVRFFRLNRR